MDKKAAQGNLLIVEDNPTNLSFLFNYLTKSGFKVLVATDGKTAIQRVEAAQPDLILLDVMMPGMDGFEVCKRLKSSPSMRDIPVIFMTALSDTLNKVHGFEIGAVDYITKPIQPEEVVSRIQTHLTLRNLQKELQAKNEHLLQSQQQEKQRSLELEEALHKLQQTEVQLIQAEKMSSFGKIAAGIAHEINNPVNFIYGNLYHANEYIQDLFELITLYTQTYTHPTEKINRKIQEIELDFIQSDLPKLLESMQVGAERIRQTVSLLKNFFHLHEAELKFVDINQDINNTLLLLEYHLDAKAGRPRIEVIKNYGSLPLVKCYASELNQVFMNMLTNAIDALDEKYGKLKREGEMWLIRGDRKAGEEEEEFVRSPLTPDQSQSPTIEISTESVDEAKVIIRIADNGSGMTEEVSQRLFDPFFSTKPVGSGTGLGLTISYQIIVEKHRGQLDVTSERGNGTEFVIEIPIQS
ncbi:response regulator receiver domain protein [Coleofasciculus chthonoplastes PCC 7420]|uniref:histidine kinase n=1 Tax=Coleofasciculus chthonoplastes PCC 7420 TaxID=118168 RepID=B4VT49_9CYAN|nr:response regulator [Coleofasciculus chthonoplastes]EDX74785.1 response regulator receiver domain protein [Coleofasciculus chthonoplastes PCC 7420]